MNELYELLSVLGNSDIPEMRKDYLESIKRLLEIGQKLDKLKPSEKTKKGIERLENIVKNYKA